MIIPHSLGVAQSDPFLIMGSHFFQQRWGLALMGKSNDLPYQDSHVCLQNSDHRVEVPAAQQL